MKAILLAAGLGTRLKPLTDTMPKCLVPIKGKPLLAYWLEKLDALGVTEILINLHYLSEKVAAFIATSPYKSKVTLIKEDKLLGTAGTLVANKEFWQNEETLVIHADNFCMSDLQAFVKDHQKRINQTDASLLLFETEQPSACGIVKLNQDNVIVEFHEKVPNPPGKLASGALFIFSPNVYSKYFQNLDNSVYRELSIDIIPQMVDHLNGWQSDLPYLDIGTPEMLEKANNLPI
ncbi:nucleotidyltransferase family protein [Thalassotalea euphylliae]|uniref:Nucleotidyltransferase family protein n=1 Tax=Thalassotalea euphylliae TaxID=1655234 RepID=A0A3E0TPR6_9GAMM|nr:nucleotidyltransferase family protein [Thalassotalea euphylliae]REL26052.1 nucleotidyltransferase family protein [Thalassotalea euphylliae]